MAKTMLLCLIHLLKLVSSLEFFCESDLCNPDQYCCGDDICCDNALDLWFLWLGVVLICFALTVIVIIRCIRRRKPTNVYDQVPTNEEF